MALAAAAAIGGGLEKGDCGNPGGEAAGDPNDMGDALAAPPAAGAPKSAPAPKGEPPAGCTGFAGPAKGEAAAWGMFPPPAPPKRVPCPGCPNGLGAAAWPN